ncbi:hypothetical protein [Stratiformator vulcanicus]|uniref:Uncharacterized protein n=1 Tax=Stratiformator vulcanicus TaxID=2527980 RepID=A0A517QW84_9PLAN|nr:hypothetical protein [Stratiformator vulcanicus]QDT35838.1 hypothetical protein Pan189_01910 [Stratiformator vulcanicus]
MSFKVDAFLERRRSAGWDCALPRLELNVSRELHAILFGFSENGEHNALAERFHLEPRPLPDDLSIETNVEVVEQSQRERPRQVVLPAEAWDLYRQMSRKLDPSVVASTGLPKFLEEIATALLKAEGKSPMLATSRAWMKSRATGRPFTGTRLCGSEVRSFCQRRDLRLILFSKAVPARSAACPK